MDAATLRIAAYVLAIVASPAVLLASVRAFITFGIIAEAIKSLKEFAERANARLDDHGERITAVETEVGNLKDGARSPGRFSVYNPGRANP